MPCRRRVCAPWQGRDSDRYLAPFNRRAAGRGRLLTVAGWGHTSLFLSSCADAYVSRYLLAPTLKQAHQGGGPAATGLWTVCPFA